MQHPSPSQNEPTSPFACPVWSRSPGQELGISRSLPVPIRRDNLLHSPSFHARQLSFQDWCFNPATSAEGQPERKTQEPSSSPPAPSDLDLEPKNCPKPEPPRMSRFKAPWNASKGAPHSRSPVPVNNAEENLKSQREASAHELEDFLSCKEVLSSAQPLEYSLPPCKRRRSCYAF